MCCKIEEIGGYFELEQPRGNGIFHSGALALNSGRNSLELLLSLFSYSNVYVPVYTCDVILGTLRKLDKTVIFYNVDSTFLPIISSLKEKSVLIYTNYYGLNTRNVKQVVETYQSVIVDNSQAFYDLPINKVPTFYSPRKFFGVPDGGYAYTWVSNSFDLKVSDLDLRSVSHLVQRLNGDIQEGYSSFIDNEQLLSDKSLSLMSNFSTRVLAGIDYSQVKSIRNYNFNYLHARLKSKNRFSDFINDAEYECPMFYPYWISNGSELRERLIRNRIFVPMYWESVLNHEERSDLETDLVNNVVALPIDQRYSRSQMDIIISVIE